MLRLITIFEHYSAKHVARQVYDQPLNIVPNFCRMLNMLEVCFASPFVRFVRVFPNANECYMLSTLMLCPSFNAPSEFQIRQLCWSCTATFRCVMNMYVAFSCLFFFSFNYMPSHYDSGHEAGNEQLQILLAREYGMEDNFSASHDISMNIQPFYLFAAASTTLEWCDKEKRPPNSERTPIAKFVCYRLSCFFFVCSPFTFHTVAGLAI